MHFNRINLMTPTYHRTKGLQEYIDSALKTACNVGNLYFTFCVNHKDKETIDYIENRYFPVKNQFDIIIEKTQQPNLALYFNMMYEQTKFNDEGTLVTMLGDDMRFITPNWERVILDDMNERDGNALIYCDDDFIAKHKLCVNLFTSRKLVDATQLPFMCTFYHADMIDVVWFEVGQMTDLLLYKPDITIRHQHEMSKNDPDETFRRLVPIRRTANEADKKAQGRQWSCIAAKNLVNAGIGHWL